MQFAAYITYTAHLALTLLKKIDVVHQNLY